jgi:hypothetical protein
MQRRPSIAPLKSPHDLFKTIPLGRCPNLGMGMAKGAEVTEPARQIEHYATS